MAEFENIDIDKLLRGEDDQFSNPIESIINLLSTPIAKRSGVFISKEDCEIWVEEIQKCYNDLINKASQDIIR